MQFILQHLEEQDVDEAADLAAAAFLNSPGYGYIFEYLVEEQRHAALKWLFAKNIALSLSSARCAFAKVGICTCAYTCIYVCSYTVYTTNKAFHTHTYTHTYTYLHTLIRSARQRSVRWYVFSYYNHPMNRRYPHGQ